jgi:hypothetical protein
MVQIHHAYITLIQLQMKTLQQVGVRSPAKHSTGLGSAIHVATLYDFAVTLKHAVW